MTPRFPDWREIELADRDAFLECARRDPPVTSELAFENLFAWRNAYGLCVTLLDGAFCALADGRNPPFLLPPVGAEDAQRTVEELFAYLRNRGADPIIERAPEAFARRLDGQFHVEIDEVQSDYVYLASDLANLAGRKYHKKRNLIARFRSANAYEYRRITAELLPQCMDLQAAWCDTRDCFTPENISLAAENEAVLEALDHYEILGLVGGAILIDGKVEAFTIGGRLNEDTLVIHFEKGNPAILGIYQTINHAFCADAGDDYTYVNREQDLGDPGLRQAKRSYYPYFMVEKYTITPQLVFH